MLPPLGATKDDLDTPALCIDLDAMEANVRLAVETCRRHGVAWRPHAKCHKSPAIARKLVEAGAIGVTCAKLGEAEVFGEAGVRDLLIANLVVGPHKVRRLVELRRKADPIVCIDHIEQAEPIARAMAEAGLELRVIIEVDIGLNRVGVACGEPAVRLARQAAELPGLTLAGVMGYEGHLLTVPDPQEKARRIREALNRLVAMRGALEQAGLPCEIVSCGGTGAFFHSVTQPGITELQAGGLIFSDAFYRNVCQVPEFQFALTVLTTVVSRPAPDRAIIDAGRKTLNPELHKPLVAGRDDITVEQLSAEHGKLRLAPSAEDVRIGDRLELVPGYGDLTTVLHDRFYAFRAGRLEAVWPLEARGRLQ
ncbi:MAG: DSD1 family PLP-dependent enzyme [Planctomycetes bacterium]|nr:DSD1 family PLP-dependent enzyme [Planctomycetota bacterium]